MTRPTISMLLPARGRPENLRASIASVFERARHPETVEVLVRLDDCDPMLSDEMAVLEDARKRVAPDRLTVNHGPRLGYARMHEYYNDLAAQARGDWLFIWNDDIEMVTDGWDLRLLDCPSFAIQFPRRDIVPTSDYTLPVIGRSIYERLGHLSRNAYCDAWISDFSAFAGTSVVRDDIVFVHHRLNDDTLREQADGNVEWDKFTADEQRALRRADMEAVLAAPEWASRLDGWQTEEVYHPVDYINLAAGERRAYSAVLKGKK